MSTRPLPTNLENIVIRGLKPEEQETQILFDRITDTMSVYTTDNLILTKLRRCMKANPAEYKIKNITYSATTGDVTSVEILAPKKYLGFRTGSRAEGKEEAND